MNTEKANCFLDIELIDKKGNVVSSLLNVDLFDSNDLNSLKEFIFLYSKNRHLTAKIRCSDSSSKSLLNLINRKIEEKEQENKLHYFNCLTFFWCEFNFLLEAYWSTMYQGALLMFADEMIANEDLFYSLTLDNVFKIVREGDYKYIEDKEIFKTNFTALGIELANAEGIYNELDNYNAIDCFDFEKYADLKIKNYKYLKGYGYYNFDIDKYIWYN